MRVAQQQAVDAARNSSVVPIINLDVDWSGPCALGGTVAIRGAYDGDSSDARASFDLQTRFDACQEAEGVLDGSVRWRSRANGTTFNATMDGTIEWRGQGAHDAMSCGIDVEIWLTPVDLYVEGSVCGSPVVSDGEGGGECELAYPSDCECDGSCEE